MPDDEPIGAVSPAERVALLAILAIVVAEAAYLLGLYLWLD